MKVLGLGVALLLIVLGGVTVAAPFRTATDAYNQGTTWVKQGQVGMGIWALTLAQRDSPRDSDILTNLDAANSRVSRPIPVAMPVLDAILMGLRRLRLTEWLALWTVATSGITVALGLRLLGRSVKPVWIYIAIGSWVGIGLPTVGAVVDHATPRVVLIRLTALQTSPDRSGVTIQSAPEGTVARVFQNTPNAVRIQLPDGSQGWVKQSDVRHL